MNWFWHTFWSYLSFCLHLQDDIIYLHLIIWFILLSGQKLCVSEKSCSTSRVSWAYGMLVTFNHLEFSILQKFKILFLVLQISCNLLTMWYSDHLIFLCFVGLWCACNSFFFFFLLSISFFMFIIVWCIFLFNFKVYLVSISFFIIYFINKKYVSLKKKWCVCILWEIELSLKKMKEYDKDI